MRRHRPRAAIVTGASSGIGEEFARALAKRRASALLAALPDEYVRLQELAAELAGAHGIRTETVAIDLTERDAPGHLQEVADNLGFEPDLLVNNAGIGMLGSVSELSLERQLSMVRLNIEAVTALTGLYLPRMVARQDGAILNVASTAAFGPLPYMAVYAASKTFVLSFSEALWAENHRHGVRVVAVCPGPVADTHFASRAETLETDEGPAGSQAAQKAVDFKPQIAREVMVEKALRAISKDQPVIVQRAPGFTLVYGAARMLSTVVPRRRQLLTMERLVRWYFGLT